MNKQELKQLIREEISKVTSEGKKYKVGDVYKSTMDIKYQAEQVMGQSGTNAVLKSSDEFEVTLIEPASDGSPQIYVTKKDTKPADRDYAVWRFNEVNFEKFMNKQDLKNF